MYEYQAELTRLVDGDTMHVQIDLGLDTYQNQSIRLYGVNTPEVRGDTKEAGQAATDWVANWFRVHVDLVVPGPNYFTLRTIKDRREKYGRYLGIVVAPDGAILNKDLVDSGHAEVYYP